MSSLHYVLVNAIGASARFKIFPVDQNKYIFRYFTEPLFFYYSYDSTHVSNELGAGNPKAAQAAATSAIFLGAIDATIVSITLYTYRGNWAYIFSNESEVAHYATQITPILCLSIGVDSFLAVLSGIQFISNHNNVYSIRYTTKHCGMRSS